MLDFETATNVDEALQVANRAGTPVQNFLVADAAGRIGWSLMGQVPVRASYDSTLPHSWREPGGGWTGWRTPEEYPRVVDPASGRLWTANARTIDTETWLAFMGDGGYDLGARAAQIRDDLLALRTASAADMAKIQLDDRALFLARWRDLLLDLLDERALAGHPLRAQARALIEHWSGRAAADDAGYRIVRATRSQVRKDVFESLTAIARQRFPNVKFTPSAQFEGPLWQLVTQRPAHLIDPHYQSWEASLLGSLDRALADSGERVQGIAALHVGRGQHAAHEASAVRMRCRSPVAGSTCRRSRCRAMQQMPRVQGEAFGASQRLVVSPGREAQGSLQLPGGPVDHPLSPFYGAGHAAWVRGEPTPLLPGESEAHAHPAPNCYSVVANKSWSFDVRALQRHRQLRRHRRPDDGRECGRDAGPSAAGEGRARHRQDAARGRNRGRAAAAAVPLAHQVDDQGAAGSVRVRRRIALARFAARRREGARHRQLHHQGPDVGGVRKRGAAGAAGRRDRQGRHRVSERPAARARPDGVLRVRDAPVDQGAAPPDHRHHQQQREGAAGRVPAPLLLPLHPLPRHRDDGAHRRRALSEPEEGAAGGSADDVLQGARDAGPEEEAVDLRAARLDQAAARRGHPAGSAARPTIRRRRSRRCTARC